jgi:CHAD domain-containing protein
MAEGLMIIDPDKAWKSMRKEGRRLFRRLGEMRDVQVLGELVRRLAAAEDPVAAKLLLHLADRESRLMQQALNALHGFDRKMWQHWSGKLHARAQRARPGSAVFQLSALQAWTEAHDFHKQALRNRSAAAYHRLRIGLKKFRYTVENFLPERHAEWSHDLKEIQDWLGEAHDLTLLWEMAVQIRAFPDGESRLRWRSLIHAERMAYLDRYRQKMVGKESLWGVWRARLAHQHRVKALSLAMIQKWALFQSVDPGRLRAIRRIATQLFGALKPGGSAPTQSMPDLRAILQVSLILNEVVRAASRKKDGKQHTDPMCSLPATPSLPAEVLTLAQAIVRCQSGKFRHFGEVDFADLPPEKRLLVLELAGILRLSRALACREDGTIPRTQIQRKQDCIMVLVEGFSEFTALAEKTARARYLLECARQQPVLIRTLPPAESSERKEPMSE